MKKSFALGYERPDLAKAAQDLAARFNFYMNHHILPRLSLTDAGLCLLTEKFQPVMIDFNPFFIKSAHIAHQNSGIVKACKPKLGLNILDLTAGWGKDAARLASFGAKVLMLERHPMMAALLNDALSRCCGDFGLSLIHVDSFAYLSKLKQSDAPDVIYFDPMHPKRVKSASVKKELQILQEILPPQEEILSLINLARQNCKQRLVIKWPQRLAPLLVPQGSIHGKTVRFDIYAAHPKLKMISSS